MAGAGAICLLFKKVSRERHVKAELIIPVYWIVSGCAFVVFLAPFMASRHVLLVMPVFLLLLYPQIKHSKNSNANRIVRTIALLLTLANTTLLAKADHWYANIYREAAYMLKSDIPPGAGIWFMGHWGWQWYAQQAGMRQLSPNSLSPRMGDYLVIPLNVDGGDPPPQLILEEMKTVSVAREYWYQRFASSNFYISPWLSWGYSEALMENFKIYRIQGSRQP
jgi:hypothetical protein